MRCSLGFGKLSETARGRHILSSLPLGATYVQSIDLDAADPEWEEAPG
jgi:hypothetical protein